MPGPPSESDYGSELDWTDAALDAALTAIERAASLNSSAINAATESSTSREVLGTGDASTSDTAMTLGGVVTAVESADAAVTATSRETSPPASLWERYRKQRGWGALSVSDLSGPSWCEVQHTYRLASKPFLPPLERPATITTAAGAVIQVDATRTVKRESILDRGKEVHRRIEKQVMGDVEEVKVNVTGKEEWWALRILNTIICLHTLLENGKVRELPVVGWLGGHLVFGVIDEVERREVEAPAPTDELPSSNAPSTPKRSRRAKNASTSPEKDDQKKLDHFFTLIRSPAKAAGTASTSTSSPDQNASSRLVGDVPVRSEKVDEAHVGDATGSGAAQQSAAPSWGYLLSDTKTRFNHSIPPAGESRPARLQLMLYHRLLSSMLEREPPASEALFDSATSADCGGSNRPPALSWRNLFAHLSLSPSAALSVDFLDAISPVIADSGIEAELHQATTLEGFVQVLLSYGDLLRGNRDAVLLDDLEIVYRMRNDSGRTYANRRGKRRTRDQPADAELPARKSAASQEKGHAPTVDPEDADLQRAIALSLAQAVTAETAIPEVASARSSPVDPAAAEQSDIDSQLEDSQLPFFANPSLPITLPSSPSRKPHDDDHAEPALPGSAFELPPNSQAAAASSTGGEAAIPPRYKLRRRRQNSAAERPTSVATKQQAEPKVQVTPSPASQMAPEPQQAPSNDPDLIGVDTFRNEPQELDVWLCSVLAYWKGERPPKGVALPQTNRCRSCEFEDGCEWREMKAKQLSEETQARKRLRAELRSAES